MSKVIHLPEIPEPGQPVVLSCGYALEKTFIDGGTLSIPLTGEETVTTSCPKCGEKVPMAFDDFLAIMHDGDLYSTMVYCPSCSEQRRREKEKTPTGGNR